MQNISQPDPDSSPPDSGKRETPFRIFLTGFMGCGKSTLGRQLAKALDWEFIDLDNYFEDKFRTSIPLFFREFGEAGFRDAERAALLDMKEKEKVIVATGGGTPCYFDNMDFMNNNGITIYIKVAPQELANRLTASKTVRPLIRGKSGDELIGYIREKLAEREPFYNKAGIIADGETLDLNGYLRVLEGAGVPLPGNRR